MPSTLQGSIADERFRIEELAGQGGYGVVYRATDRKTGDTVALKRIRPEFFQKPGVASRFAREAAVLRRLEHPNIARSVFSDVKGADGFIAMEWVEGRSLQEEMIERANGDRPFEIEDAARIIDQIGAAIDYAHTQNLVHRDLKPSNVMLTKGGGVKVLDFGLVKILDLPSNHQTTVGRILGTIDYLAPEQALGQAVDHRVDIFALTTLLFELLTMRSPWLQDLRGELVDFKDDESLPPNNELSDVIGRIVRGPRPDARQQRSEITPAAAQVITRGLAVAADDRPSTARALVAEFRAAQGLGEVQPELRHPRQIVSGKPSGFRLIAGIAIAVAMGFAIGSWLPTQDTQTAQEARPGESAAFAPVATPGATPKSTDRNEIRRPVVEAKTQEPPDKLKMPRRLGKTNKTSPRGTTESEVAKALRTSRRTPSEQNTARLRAAIVEASQDLTATKRQYVERCVLSASMVGEVKELEACARLVEDGR